jgi:hypothetical protein
MQREHSNTGTNTPYSSGANPATMLMRAISLTTETLNTLYGDFSYGKRTICIKGSLSSRKGAMENLSGRQNEDFAKTRIDKFGTFTEDAI